VRWADQSLSGGHPSGAYVGITIAADQRSSGALAEYERDDETACEQRDHAPFQIPGRREEKGGDQSSYRIVILFGQHLMNPGKHPLGAMAVGCPADADPIVGRYDLQQSSGFETKPSTEMYHRNAVDSVHDRYPSKVIVDVA